MTEQPKRTITRSLRSRSGSRNDRVGAYKVLEQIGRGGIGEVWLAEHELIGRRAAIKLLQPSVSSEQEMVSRFFNEARAAASIADPGIVQIFDFGYHSDGRAYIVMELLEGEPLDKRLARIGTMQIPEALLTIRQVASSLGAAHARNIIHRDLKPENIFLVVDPEVGGGERAKILDFGAAKLGDELSGAKRTQTAALLGTPLYMSPEQCRGAGKVDARTDIYALGCVLYELVVGETPYDAEALGALLMKHIYDPVPRASTRLSAMPQAVDELITKCMAKDPADRFANGAELAQALGDLLDAMPESRSLAIAPARKPSAPRVAGLATGTLMPAQDSAVIEDDGEWIEPAHRSRRMLAIAVVGALALGVAGVAFVALRSSSKPAAPVPAPVVAPAAGPVPPSPPPPPPPPSPAELARPAIMKTAAQFTAWAKSHAGDPCPWHGELGSNRDPWGHELAITCTEQPGAQRIGITSAGPDGKLGTDDDIVSWELGTAVTDALRGSRWAPRAVVRNVPPPPAPPAPKPAAPLPVANGKSFAGTTLGNDGIPTSR